MNGSEIINEAMKAKGWTQSALAKELGYASQTGIRNRLAISKNLRLDIFVKFLNAMGFDVIVKSRTGSKDQWVVTQESTEESDVQ